MEAPSEPDEVDRRLGIAMREFISLPEHQRSLKNCSAEFLWDDALGVPISTPVAGKRLKDESFVSSLRSALATYPLGNSRHRLLSFRGLLFHALCKAGSSWLRLAGADRITFLDNSPLTTNNLARFASDDFALKLAAAIPKFPHGVAVRGLNIFQHREEIDELRNMGFILVPFRPVFIVQDPEVQLRKNKSVRRDASQSAKNLEFLFSEEDVLSDVEFDRCAKLFEALYIGKYSSQNPHYTASFFKNCVRSGLAKIATVRRAESKEIVGFSVYTDSSSVCGGPAIGYDKDAMQEYPVYRSLMVGMMRHAASRGQALHWSSGVPSFKKSRGATEYMEYIAVRPQGVMQRLLIRTYSYVLQFLLANQMSRKILEI